MLYNPPSGSTDANAPYVGKNIAAGTQGSKVPPAALEYTQREIVAAIAASGQSPSNTILVQAAMALGRGIWVGNLTGAADAPVATLGLVLPSLLQGMRLGAVAAAANTVANPKLRVINLGSPGAFVDFPIVKADGSALAAGDIKAGRIYRFEADGAGNVIVSVDATAAAASAAAAAVSALKAPPFTQFTAGPFSAPIPAGATGCRSKTWGGGGGGGGVGSTNNGSGSAGGGGGFSFKTITGLTGGGTISGVVGAAGAAGGQGGAGGAGGTTTVGAYHSATGGAGGSPNTGGTGGVGGSGSGGDLNLMGGYGAAGAATGVSVGGMGGGSPLGGQGGGGAPGIAGNGTSPGGGGGGSGSTTINPGAAGAAGGVILEWF